MKILIIQSKMGIGDTIIYLPFIEAISKKFNCKIDLLVKKNSKVSEFIDASNCINKIIYLERDNKKKGLRHNGLFGSIKLSNELKNYKFDKVFIFNSSLRYNIICRLAGIKKIYQYPLFKKKNQHIIEAAKNFIYKSINENIKSEPVLNIESTKRNEAKSKYKINHNKLNILLGTGGSGKNKIIPSQTYVSFMMKCTKDYDCRFFLASGDSNLENNILDDLTSDKYNFDCTKLNKLSIKQTLSVIKNCSIAICNDTSFSHISAALGLETIVLIADTSILYGSYSSKMHPVLAEKNDEHLHPREKIDPDKIYNKFKEITSKLNFSK